MKFFSGNLWCIEAESFGEINKWTLPKWIGDLLNIIIKFAKLITELEKKDWIADLMYELVQDLNRWDKEEIVTVCKKIITVCNL